MVLARAFTLTMSQDRLYCSIALQYTYYNTNTFPSKRLFQWLCYQDRKRKGYNLR